MAQAGQVPGSSTRLKAQDRDKRKQWHLGGRGRELGRDERGVGLATQLEAEPRHTVLRATGHSEAPQTGNWKGEGGWGCSWIKA